MDLGFQLTPAENILCSEIGVFGVFLLGCYHHSPMPVNPMTPTVAMGTAIIHPG